MAVSLVVIEVSEAHLLQSDHEGELVVFVCRGPCTFRWVSRWRKGGRKCMEGLLPLVFRDLPVLCNECVALQIPGRGDIPLDVKYEADRKSVV